MNERYRLILALALSVEITVLGVVSAMRYVTKDNSFGFDVVVMGLAAALTALIATWPKSTAV